MKTVFVSFLFAGLGKNEFEVWNIGQNLWSASQPLFTNPHHQTPSLPPPQRDYIASTYFLRCQLAQPPVSQCDSLQGLQMPTKDIIWHMYEHQPPEQWAIVCMVCLLVTFLSFKFVLRAQSSSWCPTKQFVYKVSCWFDGQNKNPAIFGQRTQQAFASNLWLSLPGA